MISALYDSVKVYVWGNGRYSLLYGVLKTGPLTGQAMINIISGNVVVLSFHIYNLTMHAQYLRVLDKGLPSLHQFYMFHIRGDDGINNLPISQRNKQQSSV